MLGSRRVTVRWSPEARKLRRKLLGISMFKLKVAIRKIKEDARPGENWLKQIEEHRLVLRELAKKFNYNKLSAMNSELFIIKSMLAPYRSAVPYTQKVIKRILDAEKDVREAKSRY